MEALTCGTRGELVVDPDYTCTWTVQSRGDDERLGVRPRRLPRDGRFSRLPPRCCRDERAHGHGIEVEHLRARQPAVSKPVQAEHRAVEPLARGAEASLAPEHYDLVIAGGHDPRVHAAFGRSGLERQPRTPPGGAVGLGPGRADAVLQRGGPVELD